MFQMIRPAVSMFGVLTLVTGVAYPLLVMGVAQGAFPAKANGSLIVAADGKVVGSELIGQAFSDAKYFWGRPSATSPAYNAAASSGSNLGPTNPALRTAVEERVAALQKADPGNTAPVPVDLVTASGSGLDPEISLAGAEYQVGRVAAARGIPVEEVRAAVARHTVRPMLPGFGMPRVNVLALNLDLDGQK